MAQYITYKGNSKVGRNLDSHADLLGREDVICVPHLLQLVEDLEAYGVETFDLTDRLWQIEQDNYDDTLEIIGLGLSKIDEVRPYADFFYEAHKRGGIEEVENSIL